MSTLAIREYEAVADVPEQAWDGFIEASRAPVFYRHEWLRAMERATIEQISVRRYFVIYDSDSIVAVLPVYGVESSPFWHGYELDAEQEPVFSGRWAAAPSIYAFTGGIPCLNQSDSQSFAEMILESALRFAEEQDAEALGLLNNPDGSHLLRHLGNRASSAVYLDNNHVLDLRGDYESYLRALPKHVRDDFKRRRRRATDRGATCEIVGGSEIGDDLTRFHALAIEATEKHSIAPLYDLVTLGALASLSCATFLICRHGEEMLGAFLLFEDEKTIYVWCAAVDYDRLGEFSTYVFLMSEVISYAYAKSKTRIEFGRGNYAFKRKHGFQSIPLVSLFFLTSQADPVIKQRLENMNEGLVRFVEREGGVVAHAR